MYTGNIGNKNKKSSHFTKYKFSDLSISIYSEVGEVKKIQSTYLLYFPKNEKRWTLFGSITCKIFHRTPAGYTADRKKWRKGNMSCLVLLSAVSKPLSPPPSRAPVSPACGCVIRIRRTRESPPPPLCTPVSSGAIFNSLARSWGWPLIWRLWVW